MDQGLPENLQMHLNWDLSIGSDVWQSHPCSFFLREEPREAVAAWVRGQWSFAASTSAKTFEVSMDPAKMFSI